MTGLELLPPIDQVADEDGRSVVMVGTQVLVLSALATRLLAVLADGVLSLEAAAELLEWTFGAPPESTSAELTAALASDLASLGLVRIVTTT